MKLIIISLQQQLLVLIHLMMNLSFLIVTTLLDNKKVIYLLKVDCLSLTEFTKCLYLCSLYPSTTCSSTDYKNNHRNYIIKYQYTNHYSHKKIWKKQSPIYLHKLSTPLNTLLKNLARLRYIIFHLVYFIWIIKYTSNPYASNRKNN